MTLPLNTAIMQTRSGWYVPLEKIQIPSGENRPDMSDENLRPFWLGLHLLRNFPLPSTMTEDPLAMRCRAAEAWAEVPLVVVRLNGAADLVPVLLGRLPRPEINIIAEKEWLAPETADAARAALRLAGRDVHGFLLLPRFMPGSLPPVEGKSLGLPLAAAALRLCADKPLPADIVMTGEVDEQGNVLPVGHLPEKRRCARESDYPARLFFYPADSRIDTEPVPESLPVLHLEEADALLDLAGTNDVAGIAARLRQWRDNPAEFFSWLNSNPLTEENQLCLFDLAGRQRWCAACSDEACSAALETLDPYWKKIDHSQELRRRLTELFPYDKVKDLPASPGLRTLAERCKTLANHRGADCEQWIGLSDRCKKEQEDNSNLGQVKNLTTELRTMVGKYHNKFRFLPSDIRKDWLDDVRHYSRGKDPEIGKCYGFLTQHYAFCGLQDEAFECATLSLEHFKEARERVRRHIDRIYLFLDNGHPDDARRELAGVLGADTTDAALAELVARQDDSFVHAAFARLCQSLPHEAKGYPVADLLDRAASQNAHPWQLWACNMGRLLSQDQPELARRCLDVSRDICLADPDSTAIPPMILMPLAVLHTARLAPQEEILRQTEETLRRIQCHCAEGELYEPHFHPLLELREPAAVLEEVAAHTARYFPFEYR